MFKPFLAPLLFVMAAACSTPAPATYATQQNTTPTVSPSPRPSLTADERQAQSEQLEFGLEEQISQPAELPYDVLDQLASNKDFQRCFNKPELAAEMPTVQQWFEGAAVNLDGDEQPDFVVKAKQACLWGANIGPYWVFRSVSSDKHSLVMQVSTDSLEVLPSSTKGLRDIRISAATAQEVLTGVHKFDGKKYRLAQQATPPTSR